MLAIHTHIFGLNLGVWGAPKSGACPFQNANCRRFDKLQSLETLQTQTIPNTIKTHERTPCAAQRYFLNAKSKFRRLYVKS